MIQGKAVRTQDQVDGPSQGCGARPSPRTSHHGAGLNAGEGLDHLIKPALLEHSQGRHHARIGPHTEDFVGRWVALVQDGAHRIPERDDARRLMRHREILLKGARSLFRNRRALEERYQGALGLGRLEFRWTNVQVLLNDLHDRMQHGTPQEDAQQKAGREVRVLRKPRPTG